MQSSIQAEGDTRKAAAPGTATAIPTRPAQREAARRARVQLIRDGAIVRQAFGQRATHRLLPDRRHEISIRGRTATGDTLQGAIDQAREQRP